MNALALQKFETWLTENGALVEATTNQYEVFRVQTNKGVFVVYRNKWGAENWPDYLRGLYSLFLEGGRTSLCPEKKTTRNARRQIRAISDRDGCCCWFCGKPFASEKDATIEHLLSKSYGGSNHLANLVLAHSECNNAASNKSIPEKILLREELRKGAA